MTVPETHTPKQYVVPIPDGTTATLVRTWTDAQIERIIGDALDVVENLDPPDDLRQTVFNTALNLGGQMNPKEKKIAVPNLAAIDKGRK